jgi:hypothetical protein
MRFRRASILIGAALAVLAVPVAATAKPTHIPDKAKNKIDSVTYRPSIASVDLVAQGAVVQRKHGSVFVTLRGVSPSLKMNTVKSMRGDDGLLDFTPGTRLLAAAALRHRWDGVIGNGASIRIEGDKGRTTLFNLTGKPTWNKDRRELTFSANSTKMNNQAATRATQIGRVLQARITPSPVVRRSRVDAPLNLISGTRQSSSSTCSTIQPSRAGTSFCLAYDPQLGSGGQSWANVLSATMQSTPTCQVLPPPTQIGGNVTVTGQIDVYEDASSAQAALSTSASVGYSEKVVSASAEASFSTDSQTSDTSVYAIAQVNLVSGTVNFGAPTLTSDRMSQAQEIATFDDALGFLSDCGDSIPVNYTVGASWMAVLQLQTSSQADQSSLYASIKGSYGGASAAASFSGSVSSTNESTSINETDSCAGPASCFSVPGYTAPSTAGSNISQALQIFENNYNTMLTNLANTCNPGLTYSSCITQIQYKPLYQILPTKGSGSQSPSVLVSDAATAVYSVLSNFNSWSTGYQGLETSFPNDPDYWDWDSDLDNLTYTAPFCDISGLEGIEVCAEQFQDCYTYISSYLSSSGAPCLPSAFPVNDLSTVVNPATIQAPTSGS